MNRRLEPQPPHASSVWSLVSNTSYEGAPFAVDTV